MIYCNLKGGLGNYLFQIAAAYSLSLDNGTKCLFDSGNSITVHKHIDSYKNNILRNLNYGKHNFNKVFNEPYFHYNEIPYIPNLKLNGYYQSEKYFKHNRDKILELFSIDEDTNNFIHNKYNNILSKKTCSLHVRRGNYLKLPNHHPVCELNYYLEAIKNFDVDTKFLIFSDDITWCKENFISDKFIFIEDNPDYIDIWLMSLCDNNIIANSSFSWWGAWLNQNPNKKVIAPKKWFGSAIKHETKDLIPKEWIQI